MMESITLRSMRGVRTTAIRRIWLAAVLLTFFAMDGAAQTKKDKANDLYAEAYALVDQGTLGGLQAAEPKFREARLLYREIGDRKSEAYTLNEVAYVMIQLGRMDEALRAGNDAIAIFRTINEPKGEATALNHLGEVFLVRGDIPKALSLYERALPLRRQVHDAVGEGTTLNNVASAYYRLGRYQDALAGFQRAAKARQDAGDLSGAAESTGNLGTVFFILGENQKALEQFNTAFELHQLYGDIRRAAVWLNNIASVYAAVNDLESAEKYYKQSLDLRIKSGDRVGQATVLSNIGEINSRLERNEKAWDHYRQALSITTELGDRTGEALVTGNMGIQYFAEGDPIRATEYLNKALAMSRTTGDLRGQAKSLDNLMYVAVAMQQPEQAILYGKQAVNIFQTLRHDIRSLDKEIQSSFRRNVEDSYRMLIELLVKSSRIPEAEQVLRMLKQEEYFQFTGSSVTSDGSLDESIWFTEMEAADGKTRPLNSVKPAARTGSRAIVSGWKDGRTALVSTVVGENGLTIIVTTESFQRGYFRPISESKLRDLVQALRSAILQAQFDETDPHPAAQALYNELVSPIVKDLRAANIRTLVWSLDKFLRYIPVAALWDSEQGYVVESYANVVLALAGNPDLGRKPVGKAAWRALGVGVSKASGNLEALSNVPNEIETIVNDARAGRRMRKPGLINGRSLMDEKFTFVAFRRLLTSNSFKFTHAATHFVFIPGTKAEGLNSYLLLGNGEKLTLSNLQGAGNIFAGTELLTLSACDTAFGGSTADGREIEGLGLLAQRKGARSIMATLWPVADESTKDLMTAFYKAYSKSSVSKATALQQAQLSLLKPTKGKAASESRYAHPYYWAPFILIGNWR